MTDLESSKAGLNASEQNASQIEQVGGPNYGRYVLFVLIIVYIFNFIDRQILSILIEPIKADLGISDFGMGLLSGTAFAIFYATLGMPLALVADRWNRRNLIGLSLAVWSGMTALSGLAMNFWQLAVARIGVGIGEAGCSPSAHSMLADLYPAKERATALGVYALGIPIGIMFGLFAGGAIADNYGWRLAFFVVGVPGLLLSVVVCCCLSLSIIFCLPSAFNVVNVS